MTEIAHNVDYSGFFDNVTDFTTANIIKMFGWLGDGCIDEGDHDGLMYQEIYNSETGQNDYYIKAGKALLNGIYVNQDADILICSGKNYTYNKVVVARADFDTGKVQIIEQIDTVNALGNVASEYQKYLNTESYGMTRNSHYYDIPLCFWSDSYQADLRRLLNVGYQRSLEMIMGFSNDVYPSDRFIQVGGSYMELTPKFFRKGNSTAYILFDNAYGSIALEVRLMETDKNRYYTDSAWTASGHRISTTIPVGKMYMLTLKPAGDRLKFTETSGGFSPEGNAYGSDIIVDIKEYTYGD